MTQDAGVTSLQDAIAGAPSPADPRAPVESQAAQSRALIRIGPVPRSETRRPGAAFLAQLIACKRRMPQTRERRRAEPRDATDTYLRTAAAVPPGCTLLRVA
jgi:hypothetical protein